MDPLFELELDDELPPLRPLLDPPLRPLEISPARRKRKLPMGLIWRSGGGGKGGIEYGALDLEIRGEELVSCRFGGAERT